VAALVLAGGLLYWKPWAPAAQTVAPPANTSAHVPDLPSGADQTAARPVDGASLPPPPAGKPAPDTRNNLPGPPQVAPFPVPPAPPHPFPQSTGAAVPPPQPAQSGVPEAANDTAPGVGLPSEPDPGEGKVGQPARAAYRRGEELVKTNRHNEAIQEFSRALELNPNFLRAYFARGLAYLHQNRAADAFADFNELVTRQPKNAAALAQRGICHARLHDDEAALADFNKALAMRRDLPGALNGRGLVYFRRKQYPKAIREFTDAIEVSPSFGFAYLNRAHAEEAAGNQKAAQEDIQKAKALGLPDAK
jgi:Flp pilus assembly protein TadD